MYSRYPDASAIREQLLELQRGYPVVEGLMLVTHGGLVLESTFHKEDSVSRLAAVTRTLFLLSDDVCRYTGRGEMKSVHLTYKRGFGGDDNAVSRVIMQPIGEQLMVVMVLHSPVRAAASPQEMVFLADIERMIGFITHKITQEA